MGNKTQISGKLILGYLKRFPRLPTLSLAKKIYKENKKHFISVDAARSSIRYYRGTLGEVNTKRSTPEHFRDIKPVYDLPQSYADPFIPFAISQSKTLIIGDLHFPYQDNRSIILALDYAKKQKVNCILINGDLIDFATISRHEKDWKHRSIGEEFDAVRKFLKTLRTNFPKARIIFKYGNHDERWEKYLFTKAPELFDCSDFQLEILLKLGELKIEVVKDKRPVVIGKLTVLHGHELPGMGGVNPARATFVKTLESCVVNHYHRTSEHQEPTMSGHVTVVKSIGCLCGLHPAFMPVNKWSHGFAVCELDIKTGDYLLENLKIINGKVYK